MNVRFLAFDFGVFVTTIAKEFRFEGDDLQRTGDRNRLSFGGDA